MTRRRGCHRAPGSSARGTVGLLAAATALALLSGCSSTAPERAAAPAVRSSDDTASCQGSPAQALLEPADGTYFGVNLDWDKDSPEAYSQRLGRTPAVYVEFAQLPLDEASRSRLDTVVDQIAGVHGMLLLTLEPHGGLTAITPKVADVLADVLSGYNRRGVPVFARFAHEMNGSWYPWSQQPAEYVRAFRTVADAVHRRAPATATVWAPNYGGGYPFAGGPHEARPGTDTFAALDTNSDGRLSMADDPYGPYYPGDDVVDWVGMSLYHWGNSYPWGENELPEPGKFVAQLTGGYVGANGDDRAVPDFSAVYSVGKAKPLAITETAAFHVRGAGGADEMTTKRAWWTQVLDPAVAQRAPRLAMVNWFEWDKDEPEVGQPVDWTVTREPAMAAEFNAALGARFRFAADVPACG